MNNNDRPKQTPLTLLSTLPNLVTLFSVCVGLSSIRLALGGRLEMAVIALVVAMVLDGIDGRLARALKTQSDFGKELDSLADFFNFGIAPGLILYLSIFRETEYENLCWIAVMFVAVCCAYRLARFNATQSEEPGEHFEGIPAPILALLSLIPVYLDLLGFHVGKNNPILVSGFLFFCGYLAVSRMPTVSLKSLSFEQKHYALFMASAAVAFACMLIFPWETLTFFGIVYIVQLPFYARRVYARRAAGHQDRPA